MEGFNSIKATVSLLAIFISAVFSMGTVSLTEAESISSKTNTSKKVGGAVKKGGKYAGGKSIQRRRRILDRTVHSKQLDDKQLLKNKKAANRANSKYIGETEKNLGKSSNAGKDRSNILFFDEADALLGKRSDGKVKAGHDR